MNKIQNHQIETAKGLFGYVYENKELFDSIVFQTLTHDLGIIIRGDALAEPYTSNKVDVVNKLMNLAK